MFIGEFLCIIPLLWQHLQDSTKNEAPPPDASIFTRIIARVSLRTAPGGQHGYTHVAGDEDDEEPEADDSDVERLTGWRMCWMWFPAFFDSGSVLGAS
jgi:hypothetical protein